jgi:hypothetical protein
MPPFCICIDFVIAKVHSVLCKKIWRYVCFYMSGRVDGLSAPSLVCHLLYPAYMLEGKCVASARQVLRSIGWNIHSIGRNLRSIP